MEKLTSILVVLRDGEPSGALLDKAVALARRSGARLEILLADPASASALATRFSSLGFTDRVAYALDASGDPLDEAIVRWLDRHPADLVMKDADSALALRRVLHAADDLDLAMALPVPLLRVTETAWKEEMRLAAAVDVSDRDGDAIARSILHAAGLVAMQCEATLDVVYSEREARDDSLRMERAVRVARLVREFHIGGERLKVLNGPPEETLPKAIGAGDYDLLILGAIPQRRGPLPWTPALASLLANSTGRDVMLVKERRRMRVEAGPRAESAASAIRAHP